MFLVGKKRTYVKNHCECTSHYQNHRFYCAPLVVLDDVANWCDFRLGVISDQLHGEGGGHVGG